MKITKRLNEIVQFAKTGKKVCDIGCDHGIVGIELLLKWDVEYVIFSDLLELPLSSARQNANSVQIDESCVSFRVGNGLCTIEYGEVDTVVIAGMGGKNIVDILSYDKVKTRSFKRFVFQPTNGEEDLRKWLCENGFVIDDETLIYDNKIYYETLLVSKGEEVLSEKEIRFGKCINYKDQVFVQKYSEKLASLEKIKEQIPEDYSNQIEKFNKEIQCIKDMLKVNR